MRELLSGLKSEQGNDGSYDASSPYRQNKRHMIFGTYRQNLLWMSPPALEKMDDAKPVILVSNSSRIGSRDVDPVEARFVDFCKNGLALDASSYTEAIKLFKETKDVLSTNVCAIGSGTHEAERFWFSLVLYTIKKLCHKDIDNMQQAYHDNGIMLCQIFRAAKLNIADFFKELPRFVVKAGSILSKLYGTEWENRPEEKELQANCVLLNLLSKFYKQAYLKFFSTNYTN